MIKRKVQSEKRKVKVQSLKFLVLSFSFAFFALSFTLLCGCQSRQLYKDSRIMMGTFMEVISPDKEAPNIVFSEIKRIEGLLSKYKGDSEVAKLNTLGKLKVSPDTLYVLQKAKEFWQLSDGAFDITVGPLMDLWGFTDKKYYLPKKEEINRALSKVGFDKIIFNIDDNVVEFKVLGMKIDLGAIAKGYAVDCAVKKLKEHRIKSCLINAGGQIYCLGDKFGRPWNIAVRGPRNKGFWDYLKLKDKAVATSGDYEQYFINNGKRYAHIFNPKTGYPSHSGIVSVTVIAPDGLTADALSTSIFILGKDKGLKLAKKFNNVDVEIIEEKDVSDTR
jgi:thiamine biosynthesis lipoprotein